MTEMKVKLRTFYLTHQKYISLTFRLIIVAFLYALHKGDLKYIVEILKVAQTIVAILCGAPI